MILKEEQIACFQVNWENKPDNLRRIAENLNIGLESMVFVDDSLLEVEAMKACLPEITTIRYHREIMYSEFSCFYLKEDVDFESTAKRAKTYQTDVYRRQLKEEYVNYNDYLAALDMKLEIHKIRPIEYGRIAELTQRTNRCTNGVRCSVTEIAKFDTSGKDQIYSVSLADKFSDMGIVGVFGVQDNKLTIFSLSCRALGRGVEDKMMRTIQEQFCITHVVFYDTGKNNTIKKMFEETFSLPYRLEV